MRALKCAALLVVVLAGSAEAKSYAWCQVNGTGYHAYLNGIVEIEDGAEAFRTLSAGPFGKGFRDYVQASFDPKASSLDCSTQESLFFAEDYIGVLIRANPGFEFVKTGWRGPLRAAASAPAASARRGSLGSR